MKESIKELIADIEQLEKDFKLLNYKTKLLYKIEYTEKVTEGYNKWRLEANGGLRVIKEQLEKLDYKCPLCRESLQESTATIDHLQPKSKYLGLANAPQNMLIMCRTCNSAKNNREFLEWYSKIPSTWKNRLCQAIREIHGDSKLVELVTPN
ncbi:HNH endonuclease [Myxosarcina sp. GI1]|uniref:HNH endonuclease n=1 Tax=Myxosarcina sp. GI1 TaxID=1541065 RepID=UPI00056935B9|nr:HNH endonuclease signature motif containing protein [Myxosarcina sp. GI1]